MALRRAAHIGLWILLLFLLWILIRQLPVARWVVHGAQFIHSLGPTGALLSFGAIVALTMLLFPIIPLIVACGWLYGLWGAPLSLAAAVTTAGTAFSIARKLAGNAAAQALMERPKARALADLAA